MHQPNPLRLQLRTAAEYINLPPGTELTGSETVHLVHAAAAAATNEKDLSTISFWKKRHSTPDAPLENVGGPLGDQFQAQWARNGNVRQQQDIYYGFNSMAWLPQAKLGVHKLTGWTCWKRRIGTTRYLNAVAIVLDFHDCCTPPVEEMFALFNARREQVSLPLP